MCLIKIKKIIKKAWALPSSISSITECIIKEWISRVLWFILFPLFHISVLVQSGDCSHAFFSSVETINLSVRFTTSVICLSVIQILLPGKCWEKVPGSGSRPWKWPSANVHGQMCAWQWKLKVWHRAERNERIIVYVDESCVKKKGLRLLNSTSVIVIWPFVWLAAKVSIWWTSRKNGPVLLALLVLFEVPRVLYSVSCCLFTWLREVHPVPTGSRLHLHARNLHVWLYSKTHVYYLYEWKPEHSPNFMLLASNYVCVVLRSGPKSKWNNMPVHIQKKKKEKKDEPFTLWFWANVHHTTLGDGLPTTERQQWKGGGGALDYLFAFWWRKLELCRHDEAVTHKRLFI